MKAFAALLERLAFAPTGDAKVRLLTAYFRATPDPDRGHALAILTDATRLKLPLRRIVAELIVARCDAALFALSQDYAGDRLETLALMWPEPPSLQVVPTVSLAAVIDRLAGARREQLQAVVSELMDRLDADCRWLLLKWLAGTVHAGVSAQQLKAALLQLAAGRVPPIGIDDLENVWPGLNPPYRELFAWLDGSAAEPAHAGAPFRSPMLATAWTGALTDLDLAAFQIEWKWDGVRVIVTSRHRDVRLYGRDGDNVSQAFPQLLEGWPADFIADGELLIGASGTAPPHRPLVQRSVRRRTSKQLVTSQPVTIRLFDLLQLDGTDLRDLPLAQRRLKLEAWFAVHRPPHARLSEVIAVSDAAELSRLWRGNGGGDRDGLMLKRVSSGYVAGRQQGLWYKLQRPPLCATCVLLYAERAGGGLGRLTVGVWRAAGGSRELVPIGTALADLSADEVARLDAFIRDQTRERFGPVRVLNARLAVEVEFDAVEPAPRRKSGIVLRAARLTGVRWETAADTVDDIGRLLALSPSRADVERT